MVCEQNVVMVVRSLRIIGRVICAMNIVELHQTVHGKPGWTEFAEKLKKALAEEYRLDDITVVLREMTAEEAGDGEHELLAFNQDTQRFEFALSPAHKFPSAWKIADRIDSFLNPDDGTRS